MMRHDLLTATSSRSTASVPWLALIAATVIATSGCAGLDPIYHAGGETWYAGHHTMSFPHSAATDMKEALKAASEYCLPRHMTVLDSHSHTDLMMSSATVHFKCDLATE
jgi:hypothetical protein